MGLFRKEVFGLVFGIRVLAAHCRSCVAVFCESENLGLTCSTLLYKVSIRP